MFLQQQNEILSTTYDDLEKKKKKTCLRKIIKFNFESLFLWITWQGLIFYLLSDFLSVVNYFWYCFVKRVRMCVYKK